MPQIIIVTPAIACQVQMTLGLTFHTQIAIVAPRSEAMKKYLIMTALALPLAMPTLAYANPLPDCQPLYGGGASCEQNAPVTINKQVQNPESRAFVENIYTTDPMPRGGDTVTFKLTITNPTNAVVTNIAVDDIFPPYITYSKGQGSYDKTNKILHFTIDQMKPEEVKTYIVEGTVVANSDLPEDFRQCTINQAKATVNTKVSQDNILLCLNKDQNARTTPTPAPAKPPVTRGGLKIYPTTDTKETPKTGPETSALLSLFSLASLGFLLRNKAKT